MVKKRKAKKVSESEKEPEDLLDLGLNFEQEPEENKEEDTEAIQRYIG